MPNLYADYASTTPTDPRVVQAMLPYFTEVFFNASSSHNPGLQAQYAVMKARMEVASHIGARMSEIVFTSGATEAINLAILGAARNALGSGRNKIVTIATEHAAVLDSCRYCEIHNHPVVYCGVDSEGSVDLKQLADVLDNTTLLVCVMAVNNETGVKQDLRPIADLAHAVGALLMTDATQAYGKMRINVDEMGIDLMSFSGHKIYGPKGIGALYTRNRKEKTCNLEPLQFGGGQENGMRSGTLNVPGIIGLAEAGKIAYADFDEEVARVSALRLKFENAMKLLDGTVINSEGANRSYNLSNVCFHGTDVKAMLSEIPHVAISMGSACSSSKQKVSHVLAAMGRSEEQINSSVRFSFGRFTTEQEIEEIIMAVSAAHEKYRIAAKANL